MKKVKGLLSPATDLLMLNAVRLDKSGVNQNDKAPAVNVCHIRALESQPRSDLE